MENIEKYLSEENQKMYNNYQSLILFLSKENFSEFNEFLQLYIPSKVRETKERHRILNEKLFEAASNYPRECISLCELDINLDSFSRQLTDHVSIKSVFEILVKAYNSLSSLYDNNLRDHTMNLMDKSLEMAMLNQTHELTKTFETISQNEQD